MLKQRILTAIVLASLVVWALFGLPDKLLLLVFAVALLGGAWEWSALAELKNRLFRFMFLFALTGLMFLGWWLLTSSPGVASIILISIVLVWFVITFCLVMYERGNLQLNLSRAARVLLGLLLLSACFLSVATIVVTLEHDRESILLLFLLIWGADVAAYFSGKAYGKTKLAPRISPGKSWQGVTGALLMTLVIATLAWLTMNYPIDLLPKLTALSLLVVIISIAGDLFESLLKRQCGVKDSSNLLPGHGGILDRIDSLIAAGPVYALGMMLLGVA